MNKAIYAIQAVRLHRAFMGKSAFAGGMNLPEIKKLATTEGIEVNGRNRVEILGSLQHKINTQLSDKLEERYNEIIVKLVAKIDEARRQK